MVPLGNLNCFSFSCTSSNLGPLFSISSLKANMSKGSNREKQFRWRALQLRPDTSVVALWGFRFGAPRLCGAINGWEMAEGGFLFETSFISYLCRVVFCVFFTVHCLVPAMFVGHRCSCVRLRDSRSDSPLHEDSHGASAGCGCPVKESIACNTPGITVGMSHL